MTQHDYVLDNQSGANFRSDVNNALQAILTNNSSAVAPTTTAQFMNFADTSANIIQLRNEGDAAWINMWAFTASTVAPYVNGVLFDAPVQSDLVNSFTAGQRTPPEDLAYASTIQPNFNNANNFEVSALTGNLIVTTPTNTVAGQSGSMWFPQDGSGSRTISFNNIFKFPAGTAPTASTTSSQIDRMDYKVKTSTHIDASFVNNVS